MGSASLTILLLFENIIEPELVRSVHVYRQCDGKEMEVEREFLFSEDDPYVEMRATPILKLLKSLVSEACEGYKNGVWSCIFAFRADLTPQFFSIPPQLLLTRNPKLLTIPNLLNDLRIIYKLDCKEEVIDVKQEEYSEEELKENYYDCQSSGSSGKVMPVLDQDLNCLPDEEEEEVSELPDNEIEAESLSGKKKRTPSPHVAKLDFSDLVKYFDMPIVEAARKLNIGLTVLKRKCRELGIPRWPHRKIKSLDSLIRDLQEVAKHHDSKDKAAAIAVKRRQMMLENEKENIEKQPFMDIKIETKRFRQDVFKRRYRARAIEKQSSSSTVSTS